MAYSAGTAWLQIVPSFDGVQAAFDRELDKIGAKLDASLSKTIPRALAKGAPDAGKQGQKAGEQYTEGLNRALANIKAAREKIKVELDQGELDRDLAEVEAKLKAIRDAHVNLGLDDATLRAAIAAVDLDIRRIDGKTANVHVKAETAAADAELLTVLGVASAS
jgi:hypothetical protein